MGARQHPSPPSCRGSKLTRRFEASHPAPHPGKPARETDSRRDPDIGATRSAGRPPPVHARRTAPLHVRPNALALAEGLGTAWGWAPGRPEKPGASSPESYHLPEVKLAAPSLRGAGNVALLAVACWTEFKKLGSGEIRVAGPETTPSCSGKS